MRVLEDREEWRGADIELELELELTDTVEKETTINPSIGSSSSRRQEDKEEWRGADIEYLLLLKLEPLHIAYTYMYVEEPLKTINKAIQHAKLGDSDVTGNNASLNVSLFADT